MRSGAFIVLVQLTACSAHISLSVKIEKNLTMKFAAALICLAAGANGFMQQPMRATSTHLLMSEGADDRRSFVAKTTSAATAAAVATVAGGVGAFPAPASAKTSSRMWTPVKLPFEDTLYDIDFDRYVS